MHQRGHICFWNISCLFSLLIDVLMYNYEKCFKYFLFFLLRFKLEKITRMNGVAWNNEGGVFHKLYWFYYHESVLVACILKSSQQTLYLRKACRMDDYKVILSPFSSNRTCAKCWLRYNDIASSSSYHRNMASSLHRPWPRLCDSQVCGPIQIS